MVDVVCEVNLAHGSNISLLIGELGAWPPVSYASTSRSGKGRCACVKAEERAEVARWWMEKADRNLDATRLLYKRGDLGFCVNCLYYATFYAVSAVLVAWGWLQHESCREGWLCRSWLKGRKEKG